MGMSVMEYVRRQRLASAATEICHGRRIIDVALDYSFDSHAGFSKAFRKIYACTPKAYRRCVSAPRTKTPNPLSDMCVTSAGFLPSVHFEQRSGFYIAGMVLRTSAELNSVARQPAYFGSSDVSAVDDQVYALANPAAHGEYYVSFPLGTGLFRLVTGVKTDEPEHIGGGLYVDWVPPALYGVFTTAPCFGDWSDFCDSIHRTWKYIFTEWLPASGYDLDPNGLDHEYYDERCHGDGPYSMDICIPLIPTDIK